LDRRPWNLHTQIAHFAKSRRVVAINLRGHGASDAPELGYTPSGFADDIAWQCGQLGLRKPVVIGHSLGGAIALELCGRHPDLASGVMMIDSIVMTPPALRTGSGGSAASQGYWRTGLPGGVQSQCVGHRL
jgi:pimeloyl-ACP methyl ester carboxylesterase